MLNITALFSFKSNFLITLLFFAILISSNTIIYAGNEPGDMFGQILTNECDNPEDPCAKGYTLFANAIINNSHAVYLIDMSGIIINKWVSPDPSKQLAGFPAKMLPNGSLLAFLDCVTLDVDCNEIVQLNWDGEVEWSLDAGMAHHDFQREGDPVGYYSPNYSPEVTGNTLYLGHELVTESTGIYRKNHLLDPIICEVNWEGEILWEWTGRDHYNEWGLSETAKRRIWRYGKPAYPPLYSVFWQEGDYLHINSMSRLGENLWYDQGYDEFNPQNIIISSRHANFVAIISRNTGGIVWKLGPYDAIDIIGQHHAHMIPQDLPGEGNILIFDNGGYGGYPSNIIPRLYSRVLEINPVTFEIVWSFDGNDYGDKFYSRLVSSAQRMPNGNTLITLGSKEHIIEVSAQKEIVWEYCLSLVPPPVDPDNLINMMYRAYRIPPEWVPENPSGYDDWE